MPPLPAYVVASRLVASILSPGHAADQGIGESRAPLDEVLAVVQYQERLFVLQVVKQLLGGRNTGSPAILQPQSSRDALRL